MHRRCHRRDYGWQGLCIDGSFSLALKVLQTRTCHVVQAVVANRSGAEVRFATDDDFFRSGYGKIVGEKGQRSTGNINRQTTTRLVDILDHFKAPSTIDYLSLDVEGAEEAVLDGFKFERYSFRALTVERPKPRLRNTLRRRGYLYVGDHGCFGDQMWVHESMAEQAERTLQLKNLRQHGLFDSGAHDWFANCTPTKDRILRPAALVTRQG